MSHDHIQPLIMQMAPGMELGAVYVFSSTEASRRKTGRLLCGLGYRFAVRHLPASPLPDGLIAVRRPSLLDPSKVAVVAAHATGGMDDELVAEMLRSRLADVADADIPEFELLESNRSSAVPLCDAMPPMPCCGAAVYADDEEAEDDAVDKSAASCPMAADAEDEETEADDIEFEKKRWMDSLSALVLQYVASFHCMPPQDIINECISGKFILHEKQPSRLTVNGDMKIILPDYNELELRMTPLARTVYILFLLHPEGLELRDISDHIRELEEIYLLVKPGADERLARASIAELTAPFNDSLRQKLSMTRRAVKNYILDPDLARHYIIEGRPGARFRLPLDPALVTLPKALTSLT